MLAPDRSYRTSAKPEGGGCLVILGTDLVPITVADGNNLNRSVLGVLQREKQGNRCEIPVKCLFGQGI
jgi:hypothetical protein